MPVKKAKGNMAAASFVSSTPAVTTPAWKLQSITSPILSGESPHWVPGDDLVFKTPKAPSPAKTRRRTTMVNFRGLIKDGALAVLSPPGVKTRSRRSSVYVARTESVEQGGQRAGKAGYESDVAFSQLDNGHTLSRKIAVLGRQKSGTKGGTISTDMKAPKALRSRAVKRKNSLVEIPAVTTRSKRSTNLKDKAISAGKTEKVTKSAQARKSTSVSVENVDMSNGTAESKVMPVKPTSPVNVDMSNGTDESKVMSVKPTSPVMENLSLDLPKAEGRRSIKMTPKSVRTPSRAGEDSVRRKSLRTPKIVRSYDSTAEDNTKPPEHPISKLPGQGLEDVLSTLHTSAVGETSNNLKKNASMEHNVMEVVESLTKVASTSTNEGRKMTVQEEETLSHNSLMLTQEGTELSSSHEGTDGFTSLSETATECEAPSVLDATVSYTSLSQRCTIL